MSSKEKILKLLREHGELPTGRISSMLGINYYKMVPVLQEMWESGELVSEVRSGGNYWKIKEGEK